MFEGIAVDVLASGEMEMAGLEEEGEGVAVRDGGAVAAHAAVEVERSEGVGEGVCADHGVVEEGSGWALEAMEDEVGVGESGGGGGLEEEEEGEEPAEGKHLSLEPRCDDVRVESLRLSHAPPISNG